MPLADFVRIDVASLCPHQLRRSAEHATAAVGDVEFLLDAVRCAHLAVLAAMTAVLTGTAGVGAYKPKLAAKHLEFIRLEDRRGVAMPTDYTMSYRDQLDAIQQPDGVEMYGPLVLDDAERALADKLNEFRELIDHPSATLWSVATADVVNVLAYIPDLVERITGGHHRFLDEHDDIAVAAARLRAAVDTLREG